jgi:hypothetical protein
MPSETHETIHIKEQQNRTESVKYAEPPHLEQTHVSHLLGCHATFPDHEKFGICQNMGTPSVCTPHCVGVDVGTLQEMHTFLSIVPTSKACKHDFLHHDEAG